MRTEDTFDLIDEDQIAGSDALSARPTRESAPREARTDLGMVPIQAEPGIDAVPTGRLVNNTVLGADDDDYLSGDPGNDAVAGGEGSDVIRGRDGAEHIYTGGGADTVR